MKNWGRELLELFSLGVGHYTEKDVFECARAFTGWTIAAKIPRAPLHRFNWRFEFRPEEHDYGQKTFLGRTGNFNGEDIIDIILEQPACPRFVARHLYNFFVADEPQVPAWSGRPAARPGGDRSDVGDLRQIRLRNQACPANHVQLRLLQGVDVPEGQEPNRCGRRKRTGSPATCRVPTRASRPQVRSLPTWDRASTTRPAWRGGTQAESG